MTKPTPPTPDRLPPSAPEAEIGVLGCILASPSDAMLTCQELGVRGEWFYDLRHQTIFHNLTRLFETLPPETPIDLIILHQRLLDSGQLSDIGGDVYLGEIQDKTPSSANLTYYLDIVREKWLLRKVIATYTAGVVSIYDNETAIDNLLADAQKTLTDLADQSVPRFAQRAKTMMPAVIDGIEDYHRGHAQMRGLPTGLEYVDKMLCGLGGLNSKMIVIAARPSTGKTAMALDIVSHIACDASWFKPLYEADFTRQRDEKGAAKALHMTKTPVCIFSFEMTTLALVDRLVFQRARADKQRWRNGFSTDADLVPLVKASEEICKAPIFIDDISCPIEQLVAKARQLHRQHNIELFVVDYIQLVHSSRDFRGDRVQELAYISRLLATTAKILGVPFIVIAQMNRDYEKEPNRKPRLSDLKDCGAIEQDADVVGFLYEPKLRENDKEEWEAQLLDQYPNKAGNDVDWSRAPRRINLLIEKYRNGPTGDCKLLFHKSCMHFEDFTVWQKEKGYKAPAEGEPKQHKLIDDEDVP